MQAVEKDDQEEEVFNALMEDEPIMDNSQFITLASESGNFLRFQVDTGTQCNVLPVSVSARAMGDIKLKQVTPIRSSISVYGGTSILVFRRVIIQVWRASKRYKLECKLIDSERVRPLLGRKACLGMNVICYLDNDSLYTPPTHKGRVYAITETGGLHSQPACFGRLDYAFSASFCRWSRHAEGLSSHQGGPESGTCSACAKTCANANPREAMASVG